MKATRCPVSECSVLIRRGDIMCGRHWVQLPLLLQKRVLWWHTWEKDSEGYSEALREAIAVADEAVKLLIPELPTEVVLSVCRGCKQSFCWPRPRDLCDVCKRGNAAEKWRQRQVGAA